MRTSSLVAWPLSSADEALIRRRMRRRRVWTVCLVAIAGLALVAGLWILWSFALER